MKPQLILIAGPYRGGTHGDVVLIARNLQRLEQAALLVYQRGHVPVIGEWLALPLAKAAGSIDVNDEISQSYLYPVAHRLLRQCQGVLRIAGESGGADADVQLATSLGIPVYRDIAELPAIVA